MFVRAQQQLSSGSAGRQGLFPVGIITPIQPDGGALPVDQNLHPGVGRFSITVSAMLAMASRRRTKLLRRTRPSASRSGMRPQQGVRVMNSISPLAVTSSTLRPLPAPDEDSSPRRTARQRARTAPLRSQRPFGRSAAAFPRQHGIIQIAEIQHHIPRSGVVLRGGGGAKALLHACSGVASACTSGFAARVQEHSSPHSAARRPPAFGAFDSLS